MPPALSRYGAGAVAPSPVNRMMAEVAGDFRAGFDVNLGVGYVNEATIPRAAIGAALQAVLADPRHHRLACNYGGARGSANLIAALRGYLTGRGFSDALLQRREIIIGANGATSLLEGIAALLEPGVVITSDPMYYIYTDLLRRMGYQVLAVPEQSGGVPAAAVAEALDALGSARRQGALSVLRHGRQPHLHHHGLGAAPRAAGVGAAAVARSGASRTADPRSGVRRSDPRPGGGAPADAGGGETRTGCSTRWARSPRSSRPASASAT